jgi:hypothetical protein
MRPYSAIGNARRGFNATVSVVLIRPSGRLNSVARGTWLFGTWIPRRRGAPPAHGLAASSHGRGQVDQSPHLGARGSLSGSGMCLNFC